MNAKKFLVLLLVALALLGARCEEGHAHGEEEHAHDHAHDDHAHDHAGHDHGVSVAGSGEPRGVPAGWGLAAAAAAAACKAHAASRPPLQRLSPARKSTHMTTTTIMPGMTTASAWRATVRCLRVGDWPQPPPPPQPQAQRRTPLPAHPLQRLPPARRSTHTTMHTMITHTVIMPGTTTASVWRTTVSGG